MTELSPTATVAAGAARPGGGLKTDLREGADPWRADHDASLNVLWVDLSACLKMRYGK